MCYSDGMGVIHPGSKNPNWRGGRSVASNGYVLIRMPGHPLSDIRGYAYEHRLKAEELLGRPLLPGELIHHKNGDKQDNRPENLEVVASNAEHFLHHRKNPNLRRPGEANPVIACACGCGTEFTRFDRSGRPRLFVSGHNTSLRHNLPSSSILPQQALVGNGIVEGRGKSC